jgi:hypothetical protein
VRDPLRLRVEQEDGGVLELALGWAGDGPAHVDAWSAGWGTSPAALGEALLAALGEVRASHHRDHQDRRIVTTEIAAS